MLPQVPLCLSLAGLAIEGDHAPRTPRAFIEWASDVGVRAVRLDGTMRGLRARELERSARRDLASILRRLELRFAGVDLWIPPEHFADPLRADRAMSAALSTIDLAADLATLTGDGEGRSISLSLPKNADESARAFAARAEAAGVRIADHGEGAEPRSIPGGSLGVGVDPAALLMRTIDPAREVSRLGDRLVNARLSDTDGLGRAVPGSGRLDVLAYAAALATGDHQGETTLDLRGVRDPASAVPLAVERWTATGMGRV